MDEFNDLLSKHELSEEQLTLCRDIRRRGKNKVKTNEKKMRLTQKFANNENPQFLPYPAHAFILRAFIKYDSILSYLSECQPRHFS